MIGIVAVNVNAEREKEASASNKYLKCRGQLQGGLGAGIGGVADKVVYD